MHGRFVMLISLPDSPCNLTCGTFEGKNVNIFGQFEALWLVIYIFLLLFLLLITGYGGVIDQNLHSIY